MRKTGNRISPKSEAKSVLFVCNGNVFRSPSAELLLKYYLAEHKMNGLNVSSAGTTAMKQKMHLKVMIELRKFGIKNIRHRQRRLNKSMLRKSDLVIAMAEDQIDFMKNKFNFKSAVLFDELANNKKTSIWDIEDDVTDYISNRVGVEKKISKTIRHIQNGIPRLVKKIVVSK